MSGILQRLKFKGRKARAAAAMEANRASYSARLLRTSVDQVFEQYVAALPAAQNAVDLLPGWVMALPPTFNVQAGILHLFHDERMLWLCQCFGSLEGTQVLELGPLEAGHTIFLEGKGASVLGIEANKIAFLKCLVVKEIAGLTRARFLLGDFVKWMEAEERTYDLIVASGVLYHMHDPLRLLELCARRGRALFLWTHYVTDEAMPIGDHRRNIMPGQPEIVMFHGLPMRLYPRTYNNAQADQAFSGGMIDRHRWMHRDDILSALQVLGLSEIVVAHDMPWHQNGPCFSVFARAPAAAPALDAVGTATAVPA